MPMNDKSPEAAEGGLAHRLYLKFGFVDTAPDSIGVYRARPPQPARRRMSARRLSRPTTSPTF